MNIFYISEISRSKPRLKPNEISNEVLVKTENWSKGKKHWVSLAEKDRPGRYLTYIW